MADAATSLRLRRGGGGGVHYSSGVTPLSAARLVGVSGAIP